MKSTKIRIKNIPPAHEKIKSIHLKPLSWLLAVLCTGIVMLFINRAGMVFGIWMIMLSLFGIVLMPDRLLVSFCSAYLILHDRTDASKCWLIYWGEVTGWQYIRHNQYDQICVILEDGTKAYAEAFSHRSVARVMNRYIPDKEIKPRGTRRGRK